MHCPYCNTDDTRVIDSRLSGGGHQVRRRRECVRCAERFSTYETAELSMPRIIKGDDTRVPFDEKKLRAGIMKAMEKRPISSEEIEKAIVRIIHRFRTTGEREIRSRFVGEVVMGELRKLDPVAYVRFASVYRSFPDVNAFLDEIKLLEQETVDV